MPVVPGGPGGPWGSNGHMGPYRCIGPYGPMGAMGPLGPMSPWGSMDATGPAHLAGRGRPADGRFFNVYGGKSDLTDIASCILVHRFLVHEIPSSGKNELTKCSLGPIVCSFWGASPKSADLLRFCFLNLETTSSC